jgi:tRNA/rRNA methyltransferase
MSLDHCAFVLFKPKSPGNVGAVARALKNMGLRDLRIVSEPSSEPAISSTHLHHRPTSAELMAVHGRDVLADATVHAELGSALSDRNLVVGTTARTGFYRSEARPIREVSAELMALSQANRIALVFGPEDRGLTNEELKYCQRLVTIPTAPAYPSLNLAQAVIIIAYELMLAVGAARQLPSASQWARSPDLEAMLTRMAKALVAIGFLPEDNPDHIMFALRAILGRAGLRPRELDIMNGIARQILWFGESGHETLARKRLAGKKLR